MRRQILRLSRLLAESRTPDERARLCDALWLRGRKRDVATIELIAAADPLFSPPAFLQAPGGARLVCALDERGADEAAALLDGAYWLGGFSRAEIAASHVTSTAWVGARDASGALVATARAVGDGVRRAWIYDVMVAPGWRGRGLGLAVVRLLLDHPAVRHARKLSLRTRDAQALYRKLGFVEESAEHAPAGPSVTMHLERAAPDVSAAG